MKLITKLKALFTGKPLLGGATIPKFHSFSYYEITTKKWVFYVFPINLLARWYRAIAYYFLGFGMDHRYKSERVVFFSGVEEGKRLAKKDTIETIMSIQVRSYLTAEETAEYVRCSTAQIYKLIKENKIPHSNDFGRVIIQRDDIDFLFHETRMGLFDTLGSQPTPVLRQRTDNNDENKEKTDERI